MSYTPGTVGNLIIIGTNNDLGITTSSVVDNNGNPLAYYYGGGLNSFYFGFSLSGATSYTVTSSFTNVTAVLAEYSPQTPDILIGYGTGGFALTSGTLGSGNPTATVTTTEVNSFVISVISCTHVASASAGTGNLRQHIIDPINGFVSIVDNTAVSSGTPLTCSVSLAGTGTDVPEWDCCAVEAIYAPTVSVKAGLFHFGHGLG